MKLQRLSGVCAAMPFDAISTVSAIRPGRVANLQVAAIPVRQLGGAPQVLLVTTRGQGAWIAPKGWPAGDYPDCESARREAFEEAGLLGRVEPYSLGSYTYWKGAAKKRAYFQVHAFALDVERELRDWPERKVRKRCWFSPETAAKLVSNAELGALILRAAHGVRARVFSPGVPTSPLC